MRRLHVVLLSILISLTGVAVPLIAQADSYGPGSLVREVPVAGTPHVLDGRVFSVVQVGNTIILGGTFTQTRNNSSDTVIARNRLVAFDATTKEISTTFNPSPNGAVNVVLPTGDGETVYVGGSFTSIGGQARTNLAKVRVSDGAVITQFNSGTVAGQVKDLRLSNNRLWVAGAFTHIAGKAQKALATVNPTTGAFDTFMRTAIAGIHNSGVTAVGKIDVNPQGSRLVAMGNFDTLGGVKNHQLFQLDLTGTAAAASTFRTSFYETKCSSSFDSYMRDVDYSPDGSFFVVSTTGAYGGAGTACDSTARFETSARRRESPRGSTTPAVTRRTPWRSPTPSSTPAVTPVGRTTPSGETRRPGCRLPSGHRRPRPDQRPAPVVEPHPVPRSRCLRLPGDLAGSLGRLGHRPHRRQLPALEGSRCCLSAAPSSPASRRRRSPTTCTPSAAPASTVAPTTAPPSGPHRPCPTAG